MFNIGIRQLLLIFLIGFVVVGPKDLPKVARAIANAIKYIKDLAKDIMNSIDLEEGISDLKEEVETTIQMANPLNLPETASQEYKEGNPVKDDLGSSPSENSKKLDG